MRLFSTFVRLNKKWSESFDAWFLPKRYSVDGNTDFGARFIPQYLGPNLVIFDVGSGKRPYLQTDIKAALNAKVTGVDIDSTELARAPQGAYDEMIVSDICAFRGNSEADLVLCRTLLEHVRDQNAAFRALASLLKPGGVLLLFVPSRNAVFARLNLILPESWKRTILFAVFPETEYAQGFRSYYHRCTPADFLQLAQQNGLHLETADYYFKSGYFSFFLPLYVVWRFWIVGFRLLRGDQAAETFAMALRKT